MVAGDALKSLSFTRGGIAEAFGLELGATTGRTAQLTAEGLLVEHIDIGVVAHPRAELKVILLSK